MVKEIKYNGYTAQPADYEAPEGDLAVCMNMIKEDGAMKCVLPGTTVMTMQSSSENVLYIHETSDENKRYIIRDGQNIYWIDSNGNPATDKVLLYTLADDEDLNQVNSVGNTLVLLQKNEGLYYFLWDKTTSSYRDLGNELPDCNVSFGLTSTIKSSDNFDITYDSDSSYYSEFSDDNKTKVTTEIFAKVNKFIADYSTNDGKFIFPFFVRCAFRLYDGSRIKVSDPVLMQAGCLHTPQVYLNSNPSSTGATNLFVRSFIHQLDYEIKTSIDSIKDWQDIITAIDIFVSKPIYTYNESGQVEKFIQSTDYGNEFSICRMSESDLASTYHQYWTLNKAEIALDAVKGLSYSSLISESTSRRVELPYYELDEYCDKIVSGQYSTYYILDSIKLDEMEEGRHVLDIADDYLQSLVNRESLSGDDYDSRDKLVPQYSFTYNSRLNTAAIMKYLHNPSDCSITQTYCDSKREDLDYGYEQDETQDEHTYTAYYYKTKESSVSRTIAIWIYIVQDGKECVVKSDDIETSNEVLPNFIFYPSSYAKRAVIGITDDGVTKYYEVKMAQHDYLTASYWQGQFKNSVSELTEITTAPVATARADSGIPLLNRVYTSAVNNPFFYAVGNITSVGTGRIIALSSAAKAMSQGQFGEFPLYAFTTEGVWAMSVSTTTGAFSARQPFTRDVLLNKNCVTQKDGSVVFATDRGIMELSGSSCDCITDMIESYDTFKPYEDTTNSVVGLNGIPALVSGCFTKEQLNIGRFKDYVQDCRMLYDYINQRIILFNPAEAYAYVLSIKDSAWGMIPSTIKSSVNSYPEALAMCNDGATAQLVNFSKFDETKLDTPTVGLLVTRPFKFDAADQLKTIDTIIQRGTFMEGLKKADTANGVKQVLYGSRDLENWNMIWSSGNRYLRGFRGTSYKYFRLVVLASLYGEESLHSFTCQFNLTQTNQPR